MKRRAHYARNAPRTPDSVAKALAQLQALWKPPPKIEKPAELGGTAGFETSGGVHASKAPQQRTPVRTRKQRES